MKRVCFIAATLAFVVAALQARAPEVPGVPKVPGAPGVQAQSNRALLDKYCIGCHNERAKVAELTLDTMDPANPAAHAEQWEKVVRKLRGRLMPPPNMPQPDGAAIDAFVAALETSLDRAAAAAPNPGRVSLHRLNRAEYANSVRALFGIDVDAKALLPADDISGGFDNIASVLTVSPSFLEQYVGAARVVAGLAVGDPPAATPVTTLLRGNGEPPAPGPGGLPLGTQGGALVEHFFPVDGEYELRVAANAIAFLDGARVGPGARVPVTAGTHKVGVALPARSLVENEQMLHGFIPGLPAQNYGTFGPQRGPGIVPPGAIEVNGPFNPAVAPLDTPARQKLLVCRPAQSAGRPERVEGPATPSEIACATRILSAVARRAFRRPVTDADMAAPLAFFKDGRATGDFEDGIRVGLMAILASPKFLYRAELPPARVPASGVYPIGDLELASRLSFFFWSQIPDDELLELAVKGRLSDPAVLERQVRRMLADPRSKALVTNFAGQWLTVRALDSAEPDAVLFPAFSADLRDAFRREMELFVDSIFREDRSVVDLLTADYTFVNERLARHYGMAGIVGPQFRRVPLVDSHRHGLLGKGAVLMVTSYPNRTSVVLRGAWILENILGTPPAAPPPDVEAFPENTEGKKARTVRAIMEEHRKNPTCNACHGVIDPLGFALENFDAIGSWRAKDRWAGDAIDTSGRLVDGTALAGPDDLRRALTRRPGQFVQTFTEKLMMYALGRSVEHHDMPTVRAIVRDAARDNYRFSSIVLGIVKSAPFRTAKAISEN
ncbi:MAG: DUF1592 domain-containing protein [Acidimicrobiia bacterium]|nr:DUF1592 domain-containing protein [Acidimicrobiia bacterium]